MTREDFRRLALALPGVEEKSHLGNADFRIKNKIFATLLDAETGVVKLAPEQQEMMVIAEPDLFKPIRGGWGQQGWTRVDLAKTDEITLKSALRTAWGNVAPKALKI